MACFLLLLPLNPWLLMLLFWLQAVFPTQKQAPQVTASSLPESWVIPSKSPRLRWHRFIRSKLLQPLYQAFPFVRQALSLLLAAKLLSGAVTCSLRIAVSAGLLRSRFRAILPGSAVSLAAHLYLPISFQNTLPLNLINYCFSMHADMEPRWFESSSRYVR